MAYPISDVPRRIVYSGSAGVGPYAFTFEVLANTDIAVYKNTTLLTLTTDYTVSINAGTGTGTVTLVVAATGADSVTLVGDRAIQRTSDFVTGGDLFASTLNDELDSLTIAAQQVDEKADRAIRARVTDPTTLDMTLPAYGTRANKLMGFTSGGAPTTTTSTVAQIDAAVSSFVNATGNNASSILYTPAGTGAVATTVQTKLRETVSVKDFGAVGDGVTDDTLAIQNAVTYCIQNGKALYVPQGTYIINSATGNNQHSGTLAAIRLDFLTANGQGLTMFGEGRGKSIFKEGDGQIDAAAPADKKFVRMFMCFFSSACPYELGSYTFMDLTFDKNARSNSLPAAPYDYEQSHIFHWAGTVTPSVAGVSYVRCEFIDKAAGCVTMSTAAIEVREANVEDCQSTDHPTAIQPTWGQRGCFEFGMDTDLTVMSAVTCLYSQIEPTVASSSTRQRRYKISNSRIDTLEFTDSGGYSFVDVVNTQCLDSYLNRGMHSTLTNCQIKVTAYFTPYSMKVSNSRIILPYDSGTNAITPLYLRNPAGTGYITAADFDNCDIVIDSDNSAILPTGYAIIGAATTLANKPSYRFNNCRFDKRLYGTVDSYRYGEFVFNNCLMAGQTCAAQGGSDTLYYSRLVLNNCDFSNVVGNYLFIVRIVNGTYAIEVNGQYAAASWKYTSSSAGTVTTQYLARPTLLGTAAPTTGLWFQGDRVKNSEPTVGQPKAWSCTVTGTPGTWVSEGNL